MGRAALPVGRALVLFAGCGSDPGAVDAGPDANLDGDATVVTEAALFGGAVGARVGDIDIISMLPDNTVLAMGKTDAGGSATIRVYPGGTVTAVYRHAVDLGADLITWVGVSPGDRLIFGSRQFSTAGHPNTNLGSMTYAWPAQAGAGTYNIRTSCILNFPVTAPATSTLLPEFARCHEEPMDVLFLTLDGTGKLTHYSSLLDVPFTSGGTAAVSSWTPAPTGSVDVTGLPPEVHELDGVFYTVLDSASEHAINSVYGGPVLGGAFTGSFPWHPAGERTVSRMSLKRTGFSPITLYESFPTSTLQETVVAPALPPWLQGGAISSGALGEAKWFLVPNAASVHDGQLLRVFWSRFVFGIGHPHAWYFILPPDRTSISFPRLPAQFADNLPPPLMAVGVSLRVFDIPAVTGYDMLRTLPSSTVMCLECAVRAGDLQRVVFAQ